MCNLVESMTRSSVDGSFRVLLSLFSLCHSVLSSAVLRVFTFIVSICMLCPHGEHSTYKWARSRSSYGYVSPRLHGDHHRNKMAVEKCSLCWSAARVLDMGVIRGEVFWVSI